MHPALRALLTDTLQIEAYTGQDGYNMPTFAPPVAVKGRIQRRMKTVITPTGAATVPETSVFFDGTVNIQERDKVIFPDAQSMPIQGIETVQDLRGAIHHLEVIF